MSGIGSSIVSPPWYRNMPPRPRSEGKRTRIIDAAMRHFAEQGYHAARVGDIAAVLGIAKGSVFQHFGSKDGLFFEVYKKAVRSFPRYLDAPAEVRERGFFEVLRYWLASTEHTKNPRSRTSAGASRYRNTQPSCKLQRRVRPWHVWMSDPFARAMLVVGGRGPSCSQDERSRR